MISSVAMPCDEESRHAACLLHGEHSRADEEEGSVMAQEMRRVAADYEVGSQKYSTQTRPIDIVALMQITHA